MSKYYFTFGSNPQFPYQCTYLVVIAGNKKEAVRKFQQKYPNRHTNVINCSFVYSEEEWHGSLNEKTYPKEPAEIIA